MKNILRIQIRNMLLAFIISAGFTAADANAEPSASDKLFVAIEAGKVDQVSQLLKSGVGVDVVNDRGFIPLAYLFMYYRGRLADRLKIAELLISHGADVNYLYPKSLHPGEWSVFQKTIFTGDENLIRLFLKHGADPNLGNPGPLFAAVATNNTNIVRLLISKGADVNEHEMHERFDYGTPLFRAKSVGVAKLLIDVGADVNATDTFERTPLFLIESIGVVKLLIDAGADVNAKNGFGISVLSYHSESQCRRCEPSDKKFIAYLKSRGAKASP